MIPSIISQYIYNNFYPLSGRVSFLPDNMIQITEKTLRITSVLHDKKILKDKILKAEHLGKYSRIINKIFDTDFIEREQINKFRNIHLINRSCESFVHITVPQNEKGTVVINITDDKPV